MPMYDFVCPGCGHKEERKVTYEERTTQVCPDCNNVMVIDYTTFKHGLPGVK